jgi:hypothetical protein
MIITNITIIEKLLHRHQIMEYINSNHALTLTLINIRINFNKINPSNTIIINNIIKKIKISINILKIT